MNAIKITKIPSPQCRECNGYKVLRVGWMHLEGFLCTECHCFSDVDGSVKRTIGYVKYKTNRIFKNDLRFAKK